MLERWMVIFLQRNQPKISIKIMMIPSEKKKQQVNAIIILSLDNKSNVSRPTLTSTPLSLSRLILYVIIYLYIYFSLSLSLSSFLHKFIPPQVLLSTYLSTCPISNSYPRKRNNVTLIHLPEYLCIQMSRNRSWNCRFSRK